MCTYKLEITYVCASSNTIMAMNDNFVYIYCLTANDCYYTGRQLQIYVLGKQQANSSLLFIFLNAVLYTHEPVTTQQISQQQ